MDYDRREINYSRAKTAGWWGEGPMDGDAPNDLLDAIEKLDPRKAANLIEKELNSRHFTDVYSAMGVWDVVMSSKIQLYVDVFAFLGPDVAMAARKGVPRGDEWEEDEFVVKWLDRYKRGQPTGKLRGKFVPKGGHAGHVFYITDIDVDESSLDIRVEMTNQFTNERERVDETLNPPRDGAEFESIKVEEYGGKGKKQQSILLTGETYERDEYQMQVELDATTGKFKDDGRFSWNEWDKV